jgi:hypothetical protein
LKLARRKHIIFCKFIRSQEELKEAFKSTGFELPKGIHEFEPQHYPYTIFGIRTLIGIARTGNI